MWTKMGMTPVQKVFDFYHDSLFVSHPAEASEDKRPKKARMTTSKVCFVAHLLFLYLTAVCFRKRQRIFIQMPTSRTRVGRRLRS